MIPGCWFCARQPGGISSLSRFWSHRPPLFIQVVNSRYQLLHTLFLRQHPPLCLGHSWTLLDSSATVLWGRLGSCMSDCTPARVASSATGHFVIVTRWVGILVYGGEFYGELVSHTAALWVCVHSCRCLINAAVQSHAWHACAVLPAGPRGILSEATPFAGLVPSVFDILSYQQWTLRFACGECSSRSRP